MPAKSRAQQALFAIAEHEPNKLHKQNRGLLGLSHQTLHDFAATPTKDLPEKKPEGALRRLARSMRKA